MLFFLVADSFTQLVCDHQSTGVRKKIGNDRFFLWLEAMIFWKEEKKMYPNGSSVCPSITRREKKTCGLGREDAKIVCKGREESMVQGG